MHNGRRCQKCGCETKGEEAWVGGQIWCHPCADDATVTLHAREALALLGDKKDAENG